jgi:hypothetical protein
MIVTGLVSSVFVIPILIAILPTEVSTNLPDLIIEEVTYQTRVVAGIQTRTAPKRKR